MKFEEEFKLMLEDSYGANPFEFMAANKVKDNCYICGETVESGKFEGIILHNSDEHIVVHKKCFNNDKPPINYTKCGCGG